MIVFHVNSIIWHFKKSVSSSIFYTKTVRDYGCFEINDFARNCIMYNLLGLAKFAIRKKARFKSEIFHFTYFCFIIIYDYY